MSQMFAIQMEVPDDLARFRLPPAVDRVSNYYWTVKTAVNG